MIIYIEEDLLENEIAKKIIKSYPNSTILEIDNYKNIFEKKLSWETKDSIVIAKVNNSISKTPQNYWQDETWYFFKNSLNCVYDCSYCYLKWAFKNDIKVFFVNYEDIKNEILEIDNNSTSPNLFYSSDYSDNLATDNLTDFTKNFVPFFDKLKYSKMEIRTKSINIWNLLKLSPSKNVEIAFSLNPKQIISKYELKTPDLDLRINAINKLLSNWWQVWIRFLPLLEIDNYEEIYKEFLEYVIEKIDFDKISSVFIWWLLYTKQDYNKILQKMPTLDLLYDLKDSNDWYFREKNEVREYFYKLFDSLLSGKKCYRTLEQ